MQLRTILLCSSVVTTIPAFIACDPGDQELREDLTAALRRPEKPSPPPPPPTRPGEPPPERCTVVQVPPPPPGVDLRACPRVGTTCDVSLPLWCFVGDGRMAVYRCGDAPDGSLAWQPIAVAGDIQCDEKPGPRRDGGARDGGGGRDGGAKRDGGARVPPLVHPACQAGQLPPAGADVPTCAPLGAPCKPTGAAFGEFCRLTSGASAIFVCALSPEGRGYASDVKALEGARCQQP